MTSQLYIDRLASALALISKPSKFCVNAIARTAEGNLTHPKDTNAAQWCCLGAIEYADGNFAEQQLVKRTYAHLTGDLYTTQLGDHLLHSIPWLNDQYGYDFIIALLQATIILADQGEISEHPLDS